MAAQRQKRETASTRLFKSDFLEFFTHISPVTVLVVFLPLIGWLLWLAAKVDAGRGWWFTPLMFLIGLAVWTPSEYILHRFVFHFKPRNPSPFIDRVSFLMHGIHHAEPHEKTRLVMPPVVSLPLSAIFYLAFRLIAGTAAFAIFAGFLTGYVIYDMMHYALHHLPYLGKTFKMLRKHHALHHHKTPEQRFGVSMMFWDKVFGTLPAD